VAVFTLIQIISAGFGWLLLRQVTTPRMAGALAFGAAGAMWVIALCNGAPRGLVMVGIVLSIVALAILLRQEDDAVSPAGSARPQETARTHPD